MGRVELDRVDTEAQGPSSGICEAIPNANEPRLSSASGAS